MANQKIFWEANPGPQTKFLSTSANEVLYRGGAGGGKIVGLLMRAVRYALPVPPGFAKPYNPAENRSIIFRRSYKMLESLIATSQLLYRPLGGTYNKTERTWTFPSGGIVMFSYLACWGDLDNYQGQEYTFIAFDELTQWPTDAEYCYMFSRARSPGTKIPIQVFATCNPGGVGHRWVKDRFSIPLDGCQDGHSVEQIDPKTGHRRVFIPARLQDNPSLFADGEYQRTLEGLPEATRNALLLGRWDSFEGNSFPDFKPGIHTMPRFLIPESWPKWRGDDGYQDPTAVYWFAKCTVPN